MTGKDIFEDKGYADLYDRIEKEVGAALEHVGGDKKDEELTEEQVEQMSLLMDYKFRAQESLETSALYFKKLYDFGV